MFHKLLILNQIEIRTSERSRTSAERKEIRHYRREHRHRFQVALRLLHKLQVALRTVTYRMGEEDGRGGMRH